MDLKIKKVILLLKIITVLMVLNGCAAISGYKGSINEFDKILDSNICNYKMVEEKIKSNDDVILWGIQGGSLARDCKNYNKSINFFDEAEKNYNLNAKNDDVSDDILKCTASVLVNNNVNEYKGNVYEKIMVNTYKALDFVNLNDRANARVEFNRALDRQRRAKEYFKKEIIQKKKEFKEKTKNSKFNEIEIAKNKKTQDVIYKKYTSLLNNFEAYPDFVNPFTTYMSGVYFLLSGDSKKARDLLKESVTMAPKNKQILSDFKLSDKYIASLKKSCDNYAWVIYENGQSLVKDELKIDIPLFIFTDNINYTGIALPNLTERKKSYKYLTVNNNKTTVVCNMDSVIKTEFKKKFPEIVTEAVLNTVIKTIAQKQLNDDLGAIGGITGAIYQGLTNRADVRTWSALPKEFQSVRIKINNKPIKIKDDKGKIVSIIDIPAGKNALIYIRSRKINDVKIHKVIF